MKKSLIAIILIIGVILILVGGLAGNYNSLVGLDEEVNNKWAQVENQLKRRADLFEFGNVAGFASHEEEVFGWLKLEVAF